MKEQATLAVSNAPTASAMRALFVLTFLPSSQLRQTTSHPQLRGRASVPQSALQQGPAHRAICQPAPSSDLGRERYPVPAVGTPLTLLYETRRSLPPSALPGGYAHSELLLIQSAL